MKHCIIAVLVIFLIALLPAASQESADNSGIFADIGIGMNYSIVNQNAFVTPQLDLEFFLRESLMADIGFSFETHSSNFTGIQKDVNRYYTIHFMGKYFLLDELWLGAGFAYSLFLSSSTVNAVPATPGEIHPDLIKFLISVGYFSEIMEGIHINPSFAFRVVLPSEEADSFDVNLTLSFATCFNLKRK